MLSARNHKALILYPESVQELQDLAQSLGVLEGIFPVPVIVGDGKRKYRINSLKGLIVRVRLEDFEEIKE